MCFTFPCIRLISGCSVNEFWLHMKKFRDLLEQDDNESILWRSPMVEETHEMGFTRKLEYFAFDEMVPFADCTVSGRNQTKDAFIEEKEGAIKRWKEDDSDQADEPNQQERDSEPESDGEDQIDEDEDTEDEEYDGDVDILND